MTTFSTLLASGSQATTDGSTVAGDPLLVAAWIGIGVVGLIVGVVTVTIAERRLRASAAATTATATTAQDRTLVASA